jgi:DUF2946 family protein
MTRTRRSIALVASLAVLATALWPLLTSLTAAAGGEPVPLCHQAGMQVAADSMPMTAPGEPAPPRSHCPLCVLVFFAAFAPELVAPSFVALALATAPSPAAPPLQRRFTVALPESRAPPVLLAA